MDPHVTQYGCTLRVFDAPDHIGNGVMLLGRMEQEDDGRHFEVYLSPDDMRWLSQELTGERDLPADT